MKEPTIDLKDELLQAHIEAELVDRLAEGVMVINGALLGRLCACGGAETG